MASYDTKVTLAAHRGWRGKYPENTMLGFRKALTLDIDAIEMDVHMTRDYRIVVCHDATLNRTTDKTGMICKLTLDEVREADAGIKFGEEFKGEKIPTMEEFLELMATRPDVRILLELKDYPEEIGDFAYASAEETLRLCREYGIFGADRLTVITFSTGICAWLRARYTKEDFLIHGFYPKHYMRGWEKDNPYKYYDEVCLFNGGDKTPQGMPIDHGTPLADKARFKEFELMGIKPCVYYSLNKDEALHRAAYENGAIGFTSDHPDLCGEMLDRMGARKLKK
jgi:glycerophosphoryl diester phosphodiesterase